MITLTLATGGTVEVDAAAIEAIEKTAGSDPLTVVLRGGQRYQVTETAVQIATRRSAALAAGDLPGQLTR